VIVYKDFGQSRFRQMCGYVNKPEDRRHEIEKMQ
jgi:hypothetical protein